MTKDDWFRLWLHFPVGALACILTLWKEPVGVSLTVAFIAYEVMNDWRKKDWSYKDVMGFVVGYATTACGFLTYMIVG